MRSWWMALSSILLLHLLHVIAVIIIGAGAASASESLLAPVAKRIPWERNLHNETATDYYYWLRNMETDTDVIEYIHAENNYTTDVMGHTRTLQEELGYELTRRYVESSPDDYNTTFWEQGSYVYYTRALNASIYSIYCRRLRLPNQHDGPEEIILDVNQIAEDNSTDFLALGIVEVSPDETMLAFSLDSTGDEHFTLYFLNLTTFVAGGSIDLASSLLPSPGVNNSYYHLRWGSANTVYYTTLDALALPRYVYRYQISSTPEPPVLVYTATDALHTVMVTASNDNAYLIITQYGDVDSSVLVLATHTPFANFTRLYAHVEFVRYEVDHHNDTFYIRTNAGEVAPGVVGVKYPNFRILSVEVSDPRMENWREVVPHSENGRWLDVIECFEQHLAIWAWEDGLRVMYILGLVDRVHGPLIPVPLEPEFLKHEVYSVMPGTGEDIDDRRYRSYATTIFVYSMRSFTLPTHVYAFDMIHHTTTLLARDTSYTQYGYNPAEYSHARVFAPSADGRRIPISLMYKTSLWRKGSSDGGNPMFLIGYGAYGGVSEMQYDPDYLSLLERGVVVGWAHIRGDGDLGPHWWEEARVLKKRNTFEDFIASCEYLIAQGWTSSDRLAVRGRSAGGLLAGSILILKPQVFKVVIAMVPFLDAITTEMDTSIPWAEWEWPEWGSPLNQSVYEYMKTYSPQDNIDQVSLTNFPNVMVTSGLQDPRVKYYEPTKFVAKLRHHIATSLANGTLTTTPPRVVLVTDNAGHFGSTSLEGHVASQAYFFAFILDAILHPVIAPTSSGWAWYSYFGLIVGILAAIGFVFVIRRWSQSRPSGKKYGNLAGSERSADERDHDVHRQVGTSSPLTSSSSAHTSPTGAVVVVSVPASASAAAPLSPHTASGYSSITPAPSRGPVHLV